MKNEDTKEAVLYVVATPIGNLGDMSPRAVEILQQVDLILAEDTRRSRVLLNHFNIESELASYHDHTPPARTRAILQRLAAGAAMALISDAGTPAVSDPGYRLIDGAHNLDVAVRAVPGPCAAAAALSVCGLPIERFVFEGFLPARAASRRRRLQALRAETRTMLFFETPHRLSACLDDMVDIFGPGRQATLVREISKHHETARRGELSLEGGVRPLLIGSAHHFARRAAVAAWSIASESPSMTTP